VPKLTETEVADFLDEPGHLARIASIDGDGFPRVVPLWFIRDGGRVLFTPRSEAVLWSNVQRDERIAISIDEDDLPYRKVALQAHCEVVHPPGEDDEWRDLYRSIAKRYTPADAADAYVDGTDDQPRPLCAVDLEDRRTRVSTWRMPVSGEDPRGVWARRYFRPGTKWAH
jgi:nitroimidazol reductase NimA-like FMN-containing flavoprotein (pyridoxamine 5'-phosphate oxidase superfamily)